MEAAEARPSLHTSKCHIVGNLMHWLISSGCPLFATVSGLQGVNKHIKAIV